MTHQEHAARATRDAEKRGGTEPELLRANLHATLALYKLLAEGGAQHGHAEPSS